MEILLPSNEATDQHLQNILATALELTQQPIIANLIELYHYIDLKPEELTKTLKDDGSIDSTFTLHFDVPLLQEIYHKIQSLLRSIHSAQLSHYYDRSDPCYALLEEIAADLRLKRKILLLLIQLKINAENEKPNEARLQLIQSLRQTYEQVYTQDSPQKAYNCLRSSQSSTTLTQLLAYITSQDTKERVELLLHSLKSKKSQESTLAPLDKEQVGKFFSTIRDQFEKLLPQEIESELKALGKEKVDPERVIEIIDLVLSVMNEQYQQDWATSVNVGKSTFSVNQGNKVVSCPDPEIVKKDSTKAKNGTSLLQLIHHELFTHVLRRLNHPVLLPGYLDFEEGLALAMEAGIAEKELKIGGIHLRTLLVTLYDLGWSTKDLVAITQAANQHEKAESGKSTTYDALLSRLLRGSVSLETTATSSLYTKDRAYAVGQEKIRRFIQLSNSNDDRVKNTTNAITRCILQAKFDPFNLTHLLYLESVGILNETVENIRHFIQNAV